MTDRKRPQKPKMVRKTAPRKGKQAATRVTTSKAKAAKGKQDRTRRAAPTVLSDMDVHLFNEGRHLHLFDKLGARPAGKKTATQFAVWAPGASSVSVIGDFNAWNQTSHPLQSVGGSGIWAGEIDGVGKGDIYKYHIVSGDGMYSVDKADPVGFRQERPPATASVVWDLEYNWGDDAWMQRRHEHNDLHAPISIYEVHLGSWRRRLEPGAPRLTYRELAPLLAEHVKDAGFTHVEFMPLMEHPFYGSWGYQTTGYFAPTARYGTPQDFMYLIDYLHQHDIGVILDWVPSHFPTDQHGLGYFDGTHLYEHADPRQGFHPDWNSYIFNYNRHEVRSFLLSSALFWLDVYHADGLRVDAVASMLYLDYSRREGEWIPNEFGGRENIDAINFLRQFNEDMYREAPGVQTIAEESTAWPMVSRPTFVGGLGFGLKWDMGWMHDTLEYFKKDPIHRKYHHNEITFRQIYAFSENFALPLSHDEVVHGKSSLLGRMPGDLWQKFANLRLLFAYMYGQSGKKLLFMGGEFAQWNEWNHEQSLDWHLMGYESHEGVYRLVRDLNRTYKTEPALYELDCDGRGFEWLDASDSEQSTLSFLRKNADGTELVAVALNFTPTPRHNYRLGVPRGGRWLELVNTDAKEYGGSGQGNMGGCDAAPVPFHGRSHSLCVTLPPLGAVFLKSSGAAG